MHSAPERHSTQCPAKLPASSHTPSAHTAPAAVQGTQLKLASQTGVPPLQSADVLQGAHRPASGPLVMQDPVTHGFWLPQGSHKPDAQTGSVEPQAALSTHSTQTPLALHIPSEHPVPAVKGACAQTPAVQASAVHSLPSAQSDPDKHSTQT